MKVLVIGSGRLGEALSGLLSLERHDVVIVEKNGKTAGAAAERVDALVIQGDASKIKTLRDADAGSCDAAVVLTGDDETNLKVCSLLLKLDLPKIISRVCDPAKEHEYIREGVTRTVNTTRGAALEFMKLLERPGKQAVNLVAGGRAGIFEIAVREASKLAGKKIGEIQDGFVVCAIFRNGEALLPDEGKKIKKGDILTVCALTEKVRNVEKLFEIG